MKQGPRQPHRPRSQGRAAADLPPRPADGAAAARTQRHAGEVHHPSPPPLAHAGHEGPHGVHGAQHVDVEGAAPLLGGGLQEGLVRAYDAGRVDEHVDGADLAGDPAQRRLVGHVGDDVGRTADIQSRHGEADGAQPRGDRRAEPARSAGHQGGPGHDHLSVQRAATSAAPPPTRTKARFTAPCWPAVS